HPNLVTLYELGRAGQRYFFSMELVRGIPLQRYLWGLELPDTSDLAAQTPEASQSLTALSISPVTDFARLRDVFGQLCAGVSALHQAGKLHRDIKPSNALVTGSGRVVLMDFGFVSEQGQGALESTHGNMVVGTPAFMSPEQARAAPPSPTSDWYSVGAALYMVLTGQPPFFGLNLADMMQAKQTRLPIAP
ncbi:MAG: serine/threonine protein kinase, partial [Myxococcales bacterium]|nr:serine/threonine protein kinase [Myxococcales bacterium]